MIVRRSERGTALLTVLLLVALMASVAATALDRIGLATRLAANGATTAQARGWLGTAEMLALVRLEDLVAANPSRLTLAGGWLATARTIDLPDGARVSATLADGGNCFNLNSLVQVRDQVVLAPRPEGRAQFEALMAALGVAPAQARRIAGGATDYIDDDDVASPDGTERGYRAPARAANRMMADKSELRAVPGVEPKHYALLAPWLCALPLTDLSPLNVNTLLPEQAPLLQMLGVADPSAARSAIAARPPAGFADPGQFWQQPALAGSKPSEAARGQARVTTAFFALRATVSSGSMALEQVALVDARRAPARILSRQWGAD